MSRALKNREISQPEPCQRLLKGYTVAIQGQGRVPSKYGNNTLSLSLFNKQREARSKFPLNTSNVTAYRYSVRATLCGRPELLARFPHTPR